MKKNQEQYTIEKLENQNGYQEWISDCYAENQIKGLFTAYEK